MYSDANVWASEGVRTVIKTALVIGGGIAGPVAAMALQKAGIDAVVYEAYSSRADGTGGRPVPGAQRPAAHAILDATDRRWATGAAAGWP